MLRDVGLLALGWLFGLLSPIVVDAIRRKRLKTDFANALTTELNQLRARLVGNVFDLSLNLGRLDWDLLQWARQALRGIPEAAEKLDPRAGVKEALKKLLEVDKAEFEQTIQWLRSQGQQAQLSVLLGRWRLPFLESKLQEISVFANDKQRILLTVHEQVGHIDHRADEVRELLMMTFNPALSKGNRNRLLQNMEMHYEDICRRSQWVVDMIQSLDLDNE